MLFSARRDTPSLFSREETDTHVGGGTSDVLGKMTVAAHGTLELLFLRSDNVLRFPAATAAAVAETSPDVTTPQSLAAQHRFSWRGSTYLARWDSHGGGADDASMQVWRADLESGVDWRAPAAPAVMTSERYAAGFKARVSHRLSSGSLSAGVEAERDRAMYLASSSDSAGVHELAEDSTVLRAAAYAEHRLETGSFQSSVGLRAIAAQREGPALEPRVALRYRLGPDVALGVGFSRLHQPVLSLRNPASLVSALFAVDLPVIASSAGGRPGRSDQIIAELTSRAGAQSTLTLQAYWRWLHDLVLVEPLTALPFADRRYDLGSGESSGLSLSYERRSTRMMLDASYALGVSSRGAAQYEYHLGSQPRHTLTGSVAFSATPRTLLRLAAVAHSSTPTSVVRGQFEWESCDPLGVGCEAAGSPQEHVGPLEGTPVPAYVRVDAGIDAAGSSASTVASTTSARSRPMRTYWAATMSGRTRRRPTPPTCWSDCRPDRPSCSRPASNGSGRSRRTGAGSEGRHGVKCHKRTASRAPCT